MRVIWEEVRVEVVIIRRVSAPAEIQPQPVVPIRNRLAVARWIAIAAILGAFYLPVNQLMHPTVDVRTADESTVYRVNSEQQQKAIVFLATAAICGVGLFARSPARSGFKAIGGIGLILSLALFVPLWQQRACRLVVTRDAITAPLRGGLFIEAPITFRFDQLMGLQMIDSGGGRNRYQICYTKDHRMIELDMGALAEAAAAQIDVNASAHGVKVQR